MEKLFPSENQKDINFLADKCIDLADKPGTGTETVALDLLDKIARP